MITPKKQPALLWCHWAKCSFFPLPASKIFLETSFFPTLCFAKLTNLTFLQGFCLNHFLKRKCSVGFHTEPLGFPRKDKPKNPFEMERLENLWDRHDEHDVLQTILILHVHPTRGANWRTLLDAINFYLSESVNFTQWCKIWQASASMWSSTQNRCHAIINEKREPNLTNYQHVH